MTSVVVGYDGSLSSAAAIGIAADLLPDASAVIAHVWTPRITDPDLRHRLARHAGGIENLIALIEQEGRAEADRLVADGVAIARAHGWQATAATRRGFGGEGYELDRIAAERDSDLLVLGSRGLGGVRALLGSTTDVAVHFSTRPVLVVPHPMLSAERAAASVGPVVVAYDGSDSANQALGDTRAIFPDRDALAVTVGTPEDDTDRGAAEVIEPRRAQAGERAVAEAIIGYAQEHAAALIATGSRGRSATREVLLGSTAMALLHRADLPVVVVPHQPPAPDPR